MGLRFQVYLFRVDLFKKGRVQPKSWGSIYIKKVIKLITCASTPLKKGNCSFELFFLAVIKKK